jgi:Zn-dependent metalloprotease
VRPTARFQTFARATARAAVRIYGADSREARVVADGWKKVGISL